MLLCCSVRDAGVHKRESGAGEGPVAAVGRTFGKRLLCNKTGTAA